MTDLPERIFISFFNMSVTGSYIILAIILVRLLQKKAPKMFSYSLWIVAEQSFIILLLFRGDRFKLW